MRFLRSFYSNAVITLLAVFLSLTTVLIQPALVSADIFANWENDRGGVVSEGYFSNNGSTDMLASNRYNCRGAGIGGLCPVLPNAGYTTDAINSSYYRSGASSVNKARALVAELRSIYDNGSPRRESNISNGNHLAWSRTGAAFIVNTMLGYGIGSGSKTRSITPAMWTELETRLVARATNNRINWNATFDSSYAGTSRNTYIRIIRNADGVLRHDVVYDNSYNNRNGIIIYNDNGTIAYKLWYACANPVGSMGGGLPASNFNLNPTVNGTPNFGEPGASTNLTPTINNTGSTPSTSAEWRLVQFNVPAGQALPNGAVNGTFPTTHYGYGATTIDNGNQVFQRNSTNVAQGNRTLPDAPVDTRICYALSVRPASNTTGDWRHSNPFCVTIAKAPKLQVKGGDIVAGRAGTGDIVTSAITKNISGQNRTFGSWGEYAVSATGIVRGMASGAGYSGGRVNATVCNVAYLTISNAGTGTCTNATVFGGYANLPSLPAVTTRFNPTATAGATLDVATAPNQTVYRGTGTIRVNASAPITPGRWIVINAPTANIIVTSNITYTNAALTSVSQIPQIVIIADSISIDPTVTQIDAWLMATGTTGRINTCTQVANATDLRSTNCTNQLTINGPVAARTIDLRRTAGSGSGASSGDPAEIINLRPDAFLWATSYTSDAGRVPTVSTKEVPPRF